MRWPNSYRISLRRHLISAGDGPGYAVPPHGREPAEHCRLWRSPGSPNVAKAPLGGKSSARKTWGCKRSTNISQDQNMHVTCETWG